jgi:hypothetical protein
MNLNKNYKKLNHLHIVKKITEKELKIKNAQLVLARKPQVV